MDALAASAALLEHPAGGARADAENLRVSVKCRPDRSGAIEGSQEIVGCGASAGVEPRSAAAGGRLVLFTLHATAGKYEA